jgi:hypothetical protein
MSGWLKAGLIGAGILVAINVVGAVPYIGCCALPLEWVALGCIGALAAYWLSPVSSLASAAGYGALAALIAAVIGGAVGAVIDTVSGALLAPAQLAWLESVPPDVWRQWRAWGIDPRMFADPGFGALTRGVVSATCCGFSAALGAGLGALGAVIFAAIKQE